VVTLKSVKVEIIKNVKGQGHQETPGFIKKKVIGTVNSVITSTFNIETSVTAVKRKNKKLSKKLLKIILKIGNVKNATM